MVENSGKELIDAVTQPVTLNVPLRDSLNGYMEMFMDFNRNLNISLASPESFVEPMRIYYMVIHMIALITDTKFREQVSSDMQNEMEKRGISRPEISDAQRQHIQIEVSIMSTKYITSWIDQHIGLSIENRLGVT